jgi:hypothetical protein
MDSFDRGAFTHAWHRAVSGATQTILPYPPLTVQPCTEQGTRIEDVGFDFGGIP